MAKKAKKAATRKPAATQKKARQVRLPLRQEDRRQRHDEAAARRQGRQPGRDVPHRPAGAARASPSPPRSAPTTTTNKRTLPAGAARADAGRHRRHRAADRQEVRRPEEPAAGVGALRRARLDAGHDGHDPQPRPQRSDGRGAGDEDRQPALRLGLLPPLRPDVRRRRARRAEAAGRGSRAVRDGHRGAQARALSRRTSRTRSSRSRTCRSWSSASRRWSRSAPARTSRPRRGTS